MMPLEYLRVLVGFLKKKKKEIGKIWAMPGVLRHNVGTPRDNKGPCHGMACPHRGVAESGVSDRLGFTPLCHDVATVHSMEILCFCFVLPFRYSEDLSIGLMRTI